MELLSILLSAGGAGETLFIGAIIGLMTWGWMALKGKNDESKEKKKTDAALELLNELIVNKGGLPKVKEELFEYLKNTYMLSIERSENDGVVMSSHEYKVTWAVYGYKCESMLIRFINKETKKGLEWSFEFNKSQEEIIKLLDSQIKIADLL